MNPICVKCRVFYRPIKTGYYFLEGMPTEKSAPIGLTEPDKWRPYKLWSGDLYGCPHCDSQVIVGVGIRPIAEHYQDDFTEIVNEFGASAVQVNDC
jgi:hypothetical protein